jgi:hypothetical protein
MNLLDELNRIRIEMRTEARSAYVEILEEAILRISTYDQEIERLKDIEQKFDILIRTSCSHCTPRVDKGSTELEKRIHRMNINSQYGKNGSKYHD